MGRSNGRTTQNPATKFYRWNGGDGTLSYYDGNENVNVPVSEKSPFKFLVIERGAEITGGIDKNGKFLGFWSNFVLNTTTQPFVVKSKDGVEAEGFYKDIKGTVGVHYNTALYIGVPTDDGLELQHIKFGGAALNAWIDATKKTDIFKGAFAITGSVKGKKGSVTYYSPVFKYYPEVSEEADAQAKELDLQFQEYLKGYFTHGHADPEAEVEISGKPPLLEAALAATASNDAAKQNLSGKYDKAAQVDDPFGDMDIPDTEPVDDLPF